MATMQEYLEEMARRQALGWTPGVPSRFTTPVATTYNLPTTARTTMRKAVPKANLGDIAAASADPVRKQGVGRPRLTPEEIQRTASRQGMGTVGKTIRAIAPFAKVAGPLGLASFAYDALRPSQLAMADEPTDVPGYSLSENFPAGLGGGGYISPTADDTVVDQAVPVSAEIPETKWSELVDTFTPSTHADTFKPGGVQAAVDYFTSPFQAILGSSDVESGEPYSGMGDAPDLVSTGHPGMGMGGGYDLSGAGMSTVPGVELASNFPTGDDALDKLLQGEADKHGWKDVPTMQDFWGHGMENLNIGPPYTANVLPISYFEDPVVDEEMERLIAEEASTMVDDFAMLASQDPALSLGGWIKDVTASIELPELVEKQRRYESPMPVLPLGPVAPMVGPISSDPGPTQDEVDAIIERTVTAPSGNLERIAAAKAAAKDKRASDLARQKKAAADRRAADRAVAQAAKSSAAQAKSEQAKAKAVLAKAAGRDKGGPSQAEINAAIEVMTGVDTFGGGRLRGDRDSGGYSESGMGQQGGRGHPGMR